MFSSQLRYILLTVVLLGAVGLNVMVTGPIDRPAARWPEAAVLAPTNAAWTLSPSSVELVNGTTIVTYGYRRIADGSMATLAISTSTDPKLYRAGAEVPFAGSGFSVQSAPVGLLSLATNQGALLASRGQERWLVTYAYGERRGVLGAGAVAWGWSVFDAIAGHPNDYYKLYLMVPVTDDGEHAASRLNEVGDGLLQRIATWYGTT